MSHFVSEQFSINHGWLSYQHSIFARSDHPVLFDKIDHLSYIQSLLGVIILLERHLCSVPHLMRCLGEIREK